MTINKKARFLPYMATLMTLNPKQFTGRRSGMALILAASAMLAACVSHSGIESHAQLHTLPVNRSDALYGTAQANWPSSDWASAIGGAELQELIAAALAGNPSLQAAAARIDAARAAIAISRSATLPSVNASFATTYQRYSEHGLIPPPLAGNYYSDNELAVSVAYDLDFWGKHSAEMRTALSQAQVAEAEQQSVRLMLSNAVARSWLQLARQYAQREMSLQQRLVREKFDALIAQRVHAGLDTQTDIQQGVLQVAALNKDISAWDEAIALSRNQLAALLGASPERGSTIARPKFDGAQHIGVPANLPLELISRRPDIVAARWRVEANQGDIDAATTQFYPNVNLVGFAGLSSIGVDQFFKSGSLIVGVGPSIHLPLFEGGRLRAQLKTRVAAYDVAVATYNQSLTDALHEVADQVQMMAGSSAQIAQQQSATDAAQRSLNLARQRQQAGTANLLPVLSAESLLLSQQKQTMDLLFRQAESQINLIKALGGGYDSQAHNATPPHSPLSVSNNSKAAL